MFNPRTSRPTALLLALLATGSLVAGACSSDGDGKKAATTTTAAPADEPTTTEADAGDDGEVSTEDLEGVLPTAQALGDGWSEDTSPDDEDGPELAELCPEAAEIRSNEPDDDDNAKVKFTRTGSGESIEVELSPNQPAFSAEDLEAYAEALTDCEPTYTDEDTGFDYSFKIEANTLDEYGDQGLQIESEVTISAESLPGPVELKLYSLIWRHGSIGAEINGQDGVDDSFEVTEFDPDQLIELAEDLDPEVEELAG